MIPDLTLEVIYYKQPTDFKMEFALCGCCTVRFLSMSVKDRGGFLSALGKSVVRSRAIIAVGSFNPLDSEYLPKVVARATGYPLKAADKAKFAIEGAGEYPLPTTAIPLVTADGMLGGCVLENSDQSIIMLTGDRKLRHRLVNDLVCPYLQVFAKKKTKISPPEKSTQSDPPGGASAAISAEAVEGREPDTDLESVASEETALNAEMMTSKEAAASGEIAASQEATASRETAIGKASVAESVFDRAPAAAAVLPGEPAKEPAKQKAESENTASSEAPSAKNDSQADEIPTESAQDVPRYTVLEEPEYALSQKLNLEDFLTSDEDSENKPHKKHRRWIRAVISIILVAAVLLSAYFGYEWVYQPIQNSAVYKSTRELYGQIWEGLPADMLYKFGKLYQTNRDVFGWLSIPDTAINFPVVSTANRSISYYQTHLFEGSVNRFGTLYTTCRVSEDSFTRNIVIYGKSTTTGTMFADLAKFLEIGQYRAAPSFTFDSVYLENKWKIFSVFRVESAYQKNYIQTSFFDDAAFSAYLELLESASVIETNIDLEANDQLVTLVCEEGNTSVVVVARRVRDDESPLVDVTGSSVNGSPIGSDSDDGSAVQAGAFPSGFHEISAPQTAVSSDSTMADGASSRFEQQAPTSSTVVIKPTDPATSSSSSSSAEQISSNHSSSSVSSASSSVSTSSQTATSSVSGGQTAKLPTLTVTNSSTGQRVSGPANEIVARIIEAEMGSGYHIEALKAQAVAAYSWLLCNGAASGSAPQAPMKTAGARATEAANAVAGVVAVYNGAIAQTYYYAISAGRTAYCQDIWLSSLSYLVSVDSSVDKNVSGFQTIRKYAASDVAKWATESLGVNLNAISDKNRWFQCAYDANGLYVKTVTVGGVSKKGTYLRDSFFTSSRVGSANVLRSSAYTITYSESEDKFIFTVKGYGHGVGMSQTGANAYANSGMNYESILKHYYTGITLGTYFG